MERRDKKIPSFPGRTNARSRPNSHSPRLNNTPTKQENLLKGIDMLVYPTSAGERIVEGFLSACFHVVYLNVFLILRFSLLPLRLDNKHLVLFAGIISYVWMLLRVGRGSSPFFMNVVMAAHVSSAICFLGGFLGPVIFTAICFFGGFCPVIFTPDPYHHALLGIYFYGPAGFGLGGLAGAVFWLFYRDLLLDFFLPHPDLPDWMWKKSARRRTGPSAPSSFQSS